MLDLHIAPVELLQQFRVVIARQTKGTAMMRHRRNESQSIYATRPSVDVVPDKNHSAPLRMFRDPIHKQLGVQGLFAILIAVPELFEQLL